MNRQELDAIRERDRQWGEMTTGGEPWSRERVGAAYFDAGYDRRRLLAVVDQYATALRLLQENWPKTIPAPMDTPR